MECLLRDFKLHGFNQVLPNTSCAQADLTQAPCQPSWKISALGNVSKSISACKTSKKKRILSVFSQYCMSQLVNVKGCP